MQAAVDALSLRTIRFCGLSAGIHRETAREHVAKDVSNEHAHSVFTVLRQQCIVKRPHQRAVWPAHGQTSRANYHLLTVMRLFGGTCKNPHVPIIWPLAGQHLASRAELVRRRA